MINLQISLNLTALAVGIGAIIVGILVHLRHRHRLRMRKKRHEQINRVTRDYFATDGTQVTALTYDTESGDGYNLLIETEPLQKFRCSNIIETMLVSHIRETIGVRVERIFWRFPLPRLQSAGDAGLAEETLDPYLVEGFVNAQTRSDLSVEEIPWERFQAAKDADTQKQ